MSLKILVTNPDENQINKIKAFLIEENYEVDTAMNGKEAQKKLATNKYFAIILSYELKDHPAMQLLKFIVSILTGQNVILTYLDASLFENNEEISRAKMYKLGISKIINPPIELHDLKHAIEGQQSFQELSKSIKSREGQSDEVEVEEDGTHFISIKIEEFISGKNVKYK